ncbi:gliding motility-associated C-terminal domain-containing protein [Olleya sp. ITB9]|uniref:T9SS type B sorting domain-containing protein n=1 Tax=Olleya sp. ITB9 TaxID=1715648 RepID=UPI0006CF38E5|nr:gliding motility-associated C-terminal domain-containing protein [Olleya sp. ITB9]
MKKTTFFLALLFLLVGWQANSQIYLQESFDTSIPASWTITDAGDATGDSWTSGQQGTSSLDGTNAALVDSDAAGSGTLLQETLTTPVFDASAATTLFLDFDQYFRNIGSDTGTVEVWDGTAWVAVLTQTASAGGFSSPDQQHIDITAYANAAMQVRFIYDDASSWAWYWLVDNVVVYNATCPNPSALTVDDLTATSVDLSWTAGGTETAWEIVVQPSGTGVPTGSGTGTTTNTPYSDNTLSPATDYEVYVRSDCSGDFSVWSGPISFTTDCDIFTPDYLQDFTTIPANCWEVADSGDATTGPTDIGTSSWTTDGYLNNGTTGAYKINLWVASKSDWLLTPEFDLTGGPFQVEFDLGVMTFGSTTTAGTLGSDDIVELMITTDSGTTWTVLQSFDASTVFTSAGMHVVENLSTYSGATAQFSIRASEGVIDDPTDNDVFVDNFQVRSVPSCSDPLSIVAIATGDTTADITWGAGGTETEWQVWVQTAGTGEPTTDGVVTTVNNPYSVINLTPSTAYEVYVRSNCGVDGYSAWVGPVNFTTLNTPPPAPVGVACATGSSTFIFTEDFGNDTNYVPSGWTGTAFTDTNGDWDITTESANSSSTGPDITWDGNPGTHLEYEGSGNTTNVASAITPAIDLSSALDGAELSFYMHAFGGDMGTLNIGVSTSQTGPFTSEYIWTGDYQSTADEAWVPIGVNLDAYLGQVIYIEISYVGTGDTWESDMAIDQVRVEACGTFCIAPTAITVTSITETSADISWTPSGSETEWNYVLQPAGTGVPTSGTTVTTTTVSETGLNPATDYEVYVQSICGTDTSTWAGPFNFSTLLQFNFTFDCATDGPQTIDYCYDSSDTNVFTFSSTDGTPLNLTINAGQVENNFDEVVVLDSDGITNLNAVTPYGNAGQIGGLTFQSTGDTISFAIESDGSVSCQSSGYTSVNLTVTCATCINPTATFVVVDDCDNGDQFLVDVDITSLGDATSLLIEDNQGTTPVSVTTTGVQQFGPYPFNVDVQFTVSNEQDANCIINSDLISLAACPPVNDNPCNATVASVNADETCTIVNAGTLLEATDSGVPSGSCSTSTDDDVWYEFTALGDQQIIQIQNVVGGFNVDHAVYEGTDCNNLTELYCTTDDNSLTPSLTVGNTYYIRVFSAGTTATTITFDLCIQTLGVPTYCTDALPICADPTIFYPSIVGDQVAPPYIDYDCLGSQPDPQWNTIQFDDPGDYVFQLAQTNASGTGLDIDFLVWGPFTGQDSGCFELLPSSIADCSFSATATETITLSNVPANSTYIILITNYSQESGTYVFTQESGPLDGTNCDVVCDVALDYDGIAIEQGATAAEGYSDDINLCGYTSVTLTAETAYAVDSYDWYVNNIYQDGVTGPTFEATESGQYMVIVGGGICDDFTSSLITTINFLDSSTANQASDLEVCDNGSGSGVFDLESQTETILGAQDPAEFIVTYHETLSDAQLGVDAIISEYTATHGTTVFVRVEDVDAVGSNSGCASTNTSFNLLLETCIIPQGISPNNDGYNDAFDLSSFDVQSLEIFNRNGRKVYSKTNYTNQWEGQSDSGDMLPVGTYYYVMKYQGTKTKAAWVYLNR